MPTERAELSSIAELLHQITARIAVMAEAASKEKENGLAAELFQVERSLRGAHRRIGRLVSPRR